MADAVEQGGLAIKRAGTERGPRGGRIWTGRGPSQWGHRYPSHGPRGVGRPVWALGRRACAAARAAAGARVPAPRRCWMTAMDGGNMVPERTLTNSSTRDFRPRSAKAIWCDAAIPPRPPAVR